MSLSDERLIESLCRQHEDFKRVFQEHQKYKRQLQDFVGKRFLTAAEELEVARLKKMKLKVKDRMFQLMTKYAELQ